MSTPEKVEVAVATGSANFPGTGATISCQRVTAPFKRDSAITSGARVGYQEFPVAALPQRGALHRFVVSHAEGTLLMLQSRWLRNAAPIRDGAVFLRLRATGPLWRIAAKLPLSAENVVGDTFVAFEGRADVLTIEDLTKAGIVVPSSYEKRFMSPEEVDECYVFDRLSDEIRPRPVLRTVASADGTKVVEMAAAPARRMTFRRK